MGIHICIHHVVLFVLLPYYHILRGKTLFSVLSGVIMFYALTVKPH
jgi:hypothetical protein